MKLICSEDTEIESQYNDGFDKTTYSQITNLEKRIVWLHNKLQILDTISTNYNYTVSPDSFRQEEEMCGV